MGKGRMEAFTDGVIAVIITIMVLELRAPDDPSFTALAALWPTAVSYAVSYLFIAIIWINHHHLMRFVRAPTARLVWLNFLHLFLVSLVPFATQWTAKTRLAAAPVMAYAAVFVCVDAAYLAFEHAVLDQADCSQVPPQARTRARLRSILTIGVFATAGLVAA
ncbi:MAG TPA: TMEM175 family protein, partial [Burkholderiales bacterium]